jgi:hypothetical protein
VKRRTPLRPSQWLSSPPNPHPRPASVLSAFSGAPAVYEFRGPHRLYRAAGWDSTRGRMASPYGAWWADEEILVRIGARLDQFEGWLPDHLLKRAWPAHYRGLLALCRDWNDMQEVYQLDLPAADTVQGLVGATAPQPEFSHQDPRSRKTPMYAGGGEQVYFKVKNPLWVMRTKLW